MMERELLSIRFNLRRNAAVTDYIGYEALTQAATRGVMREALKRAAREGAPPGDHHFYVSFRTRAPGVQVPDHLTERFPEDMTIVIQHQYWDLEVDDSHFEIILKFAGVQQHLSVPFAAVTRFVDPAVNFGLSFEPEPVSGESDVIAPVVDKVEDEGETAETPKADNEGTVVNLDAFRRK